MRLPCTIPMAGNPKMARSRRQRHADQPGRLEGKSPTKAAAFSVVMEEPLHGYGVVAKVNKIMGIWGVLPKHIYDFLKSLEKDGLIQHRIEPIPEPPGFVVKNGTNRLAVPERPGPSS